MKKDILVDALTALMPSDDDVRALAKKLTQQTRVTFLVDRDNELATDDEEIPFGITSELIYVADNYPDDVDLSEFNDTPFSDLPNEIQAFLEQFNDIRVSDLPNRIKTFLSENLTGVYRDFLFGSTAAFFTLRLMGRFVIELSLRDPAIIKALLADNHRLLSCKPDYDKVVSFLNSISKDPKLNWSHLNRTLRADILNPEGNTNLELIKKIKTAWPFPSLTVESPSFLKTDGKKNYFEITSLAEINTIAQIARRFELYQGVNVQGPTRKWTLPYLVQQASLQVNAQMPIPIINQIMSFFTHNDVPKKGIFKQPTLINQDWVTNLRKRQIVLHQIRIEEYLCMMRLRPDVNNPCEKGIDARTERGSSNSLKN